MVLSVLPVSELLLWSQSHGLTDRLPCLYTNWSHRRFNVSCFCQSGEVFSVSQRGRTQAARHWNLITTPLVVWKHTYKPSLINSLIHSQAEKYAVMLLHVIKNTDSLARAHTQKHTHRDLCVWENPEGDQHYLPDSRQTHIPATDRQTSELCWQRNRLTDTSAHRVDMKLCRSQTEHTQMSSLTHITHPHRLAVHNQLHQGKNLCPPCCLTLHWVLRTNMLGPFQMFCL